MRAVPATASAPPEDMILPVLRRIATTYAPWIVLPFATVVGVVGYYFERAIAPPRLEHSKSVYEMREERLNREREAQLGGKS